MSSGITFIVGSPRSGTTLLGELLDLHPQIANWYEPYFVYDRYFKDRQNDRRIEADATPQVMAYLQQELAYFQKHHSGAIITDKSPRNSLKIPFLTTVYPHARFVHIVRDGRDATLSINREWVKRRQVLSDSANPLDRIKTFITYLNRQPLWRHKLAALQYQIGDVTKLFGDPQSASHTTRRWAGRVGWGPQFQGWQDMIDEVSMLEFNAMQWRSSVGMIVQDKNLVDPEKYLTIHYENLLTDTVGVIHTILDFLGLESADAIIENMPVIKSGNSNKWLNAFTDEQKVDIGPILQPLLKEFGYADDSSWYE